MPKPVYILNGPNLNRLGLREPDIYGTLTLAEIEKRSRARADSLGLTIEFRQSNHEGILIDWIHEAAEAGSAFVINAGAFTHTSLALHDALRAAGLPVVEVHLSNVYAREAFRHHSYVSPIAMGVICGFGASGYEMALDAVHQSMSNGG